MKIPCRDCGFRLPYKRCKCCRTKKFKHVNCPGCGCNLRGKHCHRTQPYPVANQPTTTAMVVAPNCVIIQVPQGAQLTITPSQFAPNAAAVLPQPGNWTAPTYAAASVPGGTQQQPFYVCIIQGYGTVIYRNGA